MLSRLFKQIAPRGNAPHAASHTPGIAILIAVFFVVVVWIIALVASRPQSDARAIASPVAVELDNGHDPLAVMDFFRIAYVPADIHIDNLGKHDALRIFFGPSGYYLPPMPLAQMARYPGLTGKSPDKLLAIRCKPADPSKVQPILATWPNVFQAITADLASQGLTCPPKSGGSAAEAEKDTANKIYCIAQSYKGEPGKNATNVLADSLKAAAELYADPKASDWLIKNYGIYPAFSGLGLSVEDSYTLDQENMNAAMVLRDSLTPEYLLKNTTLGEAGCRCIAVPYYPGRSQDVIDPDFVWQKGGDGSCKDVQRLGTDSPQR